MEAFVKRQAITWAITRSQQDPARIAHKLKINQDTLKAWASGDALPTFHQAMVFAKKLNITIPIAIKI